MIHIKRDPKRPPLPIYDDAKFPGAQPNTKVSGAAREYEQAVAFYTTPAAAAPAGKKKDFKFKVYKDKKLAEALAAIFGSKCAYCESSFAAVSPRDIEHFRPKSEIGQKDDDPLKPGYFWLAGEWENLLVSCIDCNRPRKHSVPGQSKKATLGKGTQFPIDGEHRRVRAHGAGIVSVAAEEPFRLLIHPCIDEPADHIRFDDDGLVYARADVQGKESERGRMSIDVYALQRSGLVEARKKALLQVTTQFELLRDLVREYATLKAENAAADRIGEKARQIARLRDLLTALTTGKAEYLGAIRDYMRRTRESGGFDDLIKNKIDPDKLAPA